MENETWSQVDVPYSAQRTIDLLILAAVSDPSEVVISSKSSSEPVAGLSGTKRENGSTDANQQSGKQLNLEDRSYFVVSATVEVLLLLVDYIKIIVNFSLLTTDAMGRTIEFLKASRSPRYFFVIVRTLIQPIAARPSIHVRAKLYSVLEPCALRV